MTARTHFPVAVKRLVFGLYTIGVFGVAYLLISLWLVWIETIPVRIPITQTPAQFGQLFEAVTFKSRKDHLNLKGWLLPAHNARRLIILMHGKDDSRNGMAHEASLLAMRGFAVFTFDFRGHGESEGERYTLGYDERWDALGAIDYVESRGYAPGQIGLMGQSLGAATALLAGAETTDVAAIVSDSAFADVRQLMTERFSMFGVLPVVFVPSSLWLAKPMLGVDVDAARPIDAIRRFAPRPVLLIHGELDLLVRPIHARQLAAAAAGSSELWLVPDVDHVGAFDALPAEYMQRVTAFFERALK